MSASGDSTGSSFFRRQRKDDSSDDSLRIVSTPSPQEFTSPDSTGIVTDGSSKVFTPSVPRHASTRIYEPSAPPSSATASKEDTSPFLPGIIPSLSPSDQADAGSPSDISLDSQQEQSRAKILAKSLSLPYVDLSSYTIDETVVSLVPDELCRRSQLIPIATSNHQLTIAMANPRDFAAMDDVSAITGMSVTPVVSTPSQIQTAINRYIRANEELDEISNEMAAGTRKKIDFEADTEENSSPVARFVSLLINQAIDDRCSDIHIEPQENSLEVRYRIDGVLHHFQDAPRAMIQGVISRIKILADMDIGERRRPQDGRITVLHRGRSVDLRVATLPTVWGETVVMRILNTPAANLSVDDLDFTERNKSIYRKAYSRPYGMVLVTGPTGSGKSTTLYATLADISSPEINIITVEDPVEYRMKGINQVQVNTKAGLTFATALRSILRADPDVVLIGEIRDAETATIAVEASLTGHLVLSTLHTNDAPSAVTRLTEMGVEPFLISSSLAAVASQRLARRLCVTCRIPDHATPAEMTMFGQQYTEGMPTPVVYRPKGCDECSHTGYRGRVALQQVMGVDETMESLISRGATSQEIEEKARAQGMTSLRSDGWGKVLSGITSIDEVLRVTV